LSDTQPTRAKLVVLQTAASFLICAMIAIFALSQNAGAQTPAAAVSTQTVSQKKTDDPSSPQIQWKKVPEAEKKVLAPLEKEWQSLPGQQHRKLISAAKEYPKLKPIEQERFQERLRSWSSLTPEQRNTAREKYQSLISLPLEKQQEVKARWNEKKAAPAPSAPPADAPPANK